METLDLKQPDAASQAKEDSQSNQLESPLTEYDSAESKSDQSDHDQADSRFINVKIANGEAPSNGRPSNELSAKIATLSIGSDDENRNAFKGETANTSIRNQNGVHRTTNEQQAKSNQVQGRMSDNEILVAQTKERITMKFDLLEKETGVRLKKSGLNFLNSNSQETLSSHHNDCCSVRTNENEHSSPDEVDYAQSHDSESVSSFEVKHQTMSAEKVKEQAAIRLEFELQKAQKELKLRDEEISKLSRIRREVEMELEDLTASLFEEANKMVQEAKHASRKSDKKLQEATMKNDVLQAEVKALKVLVRNTIPNCSTSSRPGSLKGAKPTSSSAPSSSNGLNLIKNQFTPKLIRSPKNSIRAIINRTSIPFHSRTSKITVSKLMKCEKSRSCKKSPSNYELASEVSHYMSEQPNESTVLEKVKEETDQCINDAKKFGEIDPILYEEFLEWKKKPVLNKEDSQFMRRIYQEDVETTMNFKNKRLTCEVLEAIKQNNIIIELNPDKSNFQKKCALLDTPRICNYRMKLNDEWLNISQLCRDRTSAVCDLFCYLRYIQQGLVKRSGLTEIYWEIIRRRRNVMLAKLGFSAL